MNRNMDRFSDDFMFQLNRGKFRNLMFQNGIPSFKAPFWHLKKWKVNMMKLKIWRACLTLAATLLINTSLFASDFYTCTRVVGVMLEKAKFWPWRCFHTKKY